MSNTPEAIWANPDGDVISIRNGYPDLNTLIETGQLTKYVRADRIEELEDRLNFLIQPEMIAPSLSYRGWVIRDEDNGHYWQAYNYNWNAAEWESQDFISMAGNLDDVIEAIDRRIAKLSGGKDE